MAVVDVQDQLEWEARVRPRAAVIAIVAAVAGIAAIVLYQAVNSQTPTALGLDALRNLELPGSIGDAPTAQLDKLEHQRDEVLLGSGWALAWALSLIATGLALAFVGVCTRARSGKPNTLLLRSPAVGGTLLGVGIVVLGIAQQQMARDVLDGARTVTSVREAAPALGSVGSGLFVLGMFAFAAGGIVVCLNAMRAGLLTRVMAIIGMFACGAIPLYLGSPQPLLPLWTVFLAPLFLGRWMGGQPPAWKTGNAEPWPSAAVLREERMRAKGKLAAPDPVAVERAAGGRDQSSPHPSSKKRKRKRRT